MFEFAASLLWRSIPYTKQNPKPSIFEEELTVAESFHMGKETFVLSLSSEDEDGYSLGMVKEVLTSANAQKQDKAFKEDLINHGNLLLLRPLIPYIPENSAKYAGDWADYMYRLDDSSTWENEAEEEEEEEMEWLAEVGDFGDFKNDQKRKASLIEEEEESDPDSEDDQVKEMEWLAEVGDFGDVEKEKERRKQLKEKRRLEREQKQRGRLEQERREKELKEKEQKERRERRQRELAEWKMRIQWQQAEFDRQNSQSNNLPSQELPGPQSPKKQTPNLQLDQNHNEFEKPEKSAQVAEDAETSISQEIPENFEHSTDFPIMAQRKRSKMKTQKGGKKKASRNPTQGTFDEYCFTPEKLGKAGCRYALGNVSQGFWEHQSRVVMVPMARVRDLNLQGQRDGNMQDQAEGQWTNVEPSGDQIHVVYCLKRDVDKLLKKLKKAADQSIASIIQPTNEISPRKSRNSNQSEESLHVAFFQLTLEKQLETRGELLEESIQLSERVDLIVKSIPRDHSKIGESGWKLLGSQDNIDFYRKKAEGGNFCSIVGQVILDNPASLLFSYMKELQNRTKYEAYLDSCEELHKIDPFTSILSLHFSTEKGLIKIERDFVVLARTCASGDQYFLVGNSVDIPGKPLSEVIRGQLVDSGWVLHPYGTENKSCLVSIVINVNLQGWILPFSADVFLRAQIATSISKLLANV